jgi:hypothetical protein
MAFDFKRRPSSSVEMKAAPKKDSKMQKLLQKSAKSANASELSIEGRGLSEK